MARIANRDALLQVQNRIPFKGNNMYAEQRGDKYVVFSYGEHFPMFIYDNGTWFENLDNYSVTTSKHRSQAYPLCDTTRINTQAMKTILQ